MFKKLTALIAMLALTACTLTAAKKDVTALGQSFATCAKADVGKALDSGGTILSAVIAAVSAGGVNWIADLDAVALVVGDDAMTCAIAAVEAVLKPAANSGSGSGSAVATRSSASLGSDVADIVARADAYKLVLAKRAAAGESFQPKVK